MNSAFDNEIHLKLLKLIEEESELTQREMNQRMGVSLGKINYCISALSQKGMIKIERFKKSQHKSAYMYKLTPKGLEELANLTISYLKIRIAEYDQIKAEIKLLSEQIDKMDPAIRKDPDLIKDLKKIG